MKKLRIYKRHCVTSVAALALLLCVDASSQAETILLSGATVHTVSGETLSPGNVLIRDGKIVAVGAKASAKADKTVDLAGQHLYPGFILPSTTLGLQEISAVRATRDFREVGTYTPDVQSWLSVNPDSELLPVARANGITHFLPIPSGGIVTGTSGLMQLGGWTIEDMVVKRQVAMHVFWPSMNLRVNDGDKNKAKPVDQQVKDRRERIKAIDDFFEEARAYAKTRANGGKSKPADVVPAWEAMLPVVDGKIPVFIHADELREIKAAVTWASGLSLKSVIVGGRDSWKVASFLATNSVPVIFEHVFTQPSTDTESYDSHFRAASILQKAGVRFAFSEGMESSGAYNARNLPYSAAQSVAFGLPAEAALKAITLAPAQILGVDKRIGSIEKGKDATLFASDGDILDIRSHVTRMWIEGKEASLESRHTRLYEKYKARPRAGK